MRRLRRIQWLATGVFLASLASLPLVHWQEWTLGLRRSAHLEGVLMMLCLAMMIVVVLCDRLPEEGNRD